MRDDLQRKLMALHSLKRQGAKMTAPPYAQLKVILAPLKTYTLNGETSTKQLLEIQSQFQTMAQGKNTISSKNSNYARVNQLRKRAEALVSTLEDTVDDYEEAAEDVENFMALSQINEIDVLKTKVQLNRFLIKLDANISLVRSRGSMVQAHALGKSRAMYQQMSKLLALIESERVEVSKIISRFSREANKQTKLWIGPGLFTFEIMRKCEKQAHNIGKIGDAISKQAALLEQ
ncbi:MAG: hypothetical protein HOK28_03130 [Deltaproteobacteria bacterium]|nr:hypothetical protein [Deltaproteobacteria bacterium]